MTRPSSKSPLIPFPAKLPIPIGDPGDMTKPWVVCFNEDYLPYVLGALGALERAEIWDTSVASEITDATERMQTLAGLFMESCAVAEGTLLLEPCGTGCGIQYSTDGGATWTCIDLSGCIADIVGIGIDGALANGILAPGGSNSSPQSDIPPLECRTWHVQLEAGKIWRSPIPVSAGDNVTVSHAEGAWSSGYLGPLAAWCCPTGQEFLLGQCIDYRLPNIADPDQNAWHMELLMKLEDNYFLPMRGPVTITPPLGDGYLYFMANNFNAPDGNGIITFDVELCRGTQVWTHVFDFRQGEQHGWEVTPGYATVFAPWASGNWGFGAAQYLGFRMPIPAGLSGQLMTRWEYDSVDYLRDNIQVQEIGTGACNFGPLTTSAYGIDIPDYCLVTGDYLFMHLDNPAGVVVQTVTIKGIGNSDPFLGM